MKTIIPIRMRAEARDKLKVIAALERKPMGDLIEELIDAKYTLMVAVGPNGAKSKKNHDKKKRGF